MKKQNIQYIFIFFLILLSLIVKADEATDLQNLTQSLKNVQTINSSAPCDICNVGTKLSHDKSSLLQDINSDKLELSVLSPEEANLLVTEFLADKSIPFDYALDGCYARAHVMAESMDKKGIISGKAFVMGQLYAKTKYGNAHWRYHVAPVVMVKINDKVAPYIIDPALFDHAVPYEEWRNLITGQRPNMPKHIKSLYVEYYTNRFVYGPDDAKSKLTEFQDTDLADANSTLASLSAIRDQLDNKSKN